MGSPHRIVRDHVARDVTLYHWHTRHTHATTLCPSLLRLLHVPHTGEREFSPSLLTVLSPFVFSLRHLLSLIILPPFLRIFALSPCTSLSLSPPTHLFVYPSIDLSVSVPRSLGRRTRRRIMVVRCMEILPRRPVSCQRAEFREKRTRVGWKKEYVTNVQETAHTRSKSTVGGRID